MPRDGNPERETVSDAAWGPARIDTPHPAVRVGRDPDAGVVLRHPAVSRQHAELRIDSGRLLVRDLGSRLGTYVNGRRVAEQVLAEGDHIGFGPVGYQVRGNGLMLIDAVRGVRIEARGLAVERDGRRLLEDVHLDIAPNQFVGLLGASGAGKSTLLKCLAGYLRPAAGVLLVNEELRLPDHLESYRPIVGYVPQDDLIHGRLTARENLDFALRLRLGGLTPSERTDVVAAALDQLRLTDHADRPARLLSGGERKRLNVGLELLGKPRVLFLDEPTSGLDPAAEARLMRLLKSLAGEGVTIICATHILENLNLFDRVVVVANRTVVFSGSPGGLFSHFRAAGHAELYERLESFAAPPRTDASPASRILDGVQLVPRTLPPPEAPPLQIPLPTQVLVQFQRSLRVMLRDPALVLLLLGQPLLIGLLINLAQQHPKMGMPVLSLFGVLTCIWLGLNNTAREVVRDRRLYVRERLLGVTPEGYLSSRVLLFGAVGLVQVLLLVLVVRFANFLEPRYDGPWLRQLWPLPGVILILWATYLSAMLLGLTASTVADSEESAVAALPLIILPQLLLTGVVTGTEENSHRTGAFRSLVVFLRKSGEEPRTYLDWFVELISLPLYSRPALALLQLPVTGVPLPPIWLIALVDWVHMLILLVATTAFLVAAFRWKEQAWERQA